MKEIKTEKLQILFDKLKNDKKALLIISIGLIGILLISLSEIAPSENSMQDDKEINSIYDYREETDELEDIISNIKGVGRVSVMITYEGTMENIYAYNISQQNSDKDVKKEEEHIILDKGSTEEGMLLKTVYPAVVGVAVVCEGGGSPAVKNEITQLIKALYNISSNSISISEMNS